MSRKLSIEYKASMDFITKVITTLTLMLLAFIGYHLFNTLIYHLNHSSVLIITVVAFLLLATILYSWLYAPVSYSVDDQYFSINRRINSKKIKLNNLKEIRVIKPRELRFVIRTFGVGGLFGHFGKYYSSSLGNLTFYATRLTKRILIKTKQGEKIIVTPDRAEIITDLQMRIRDQG